MPEPVRVRINGYERYIQESKVKRKLFAGKHGDIFKYLNFLALILMAAGLLILGVLGFRAAQKAYSAKICFRVGHDGQTDTISLWAADNGLDAPSYYLFLPSYAAPA